MTRRTFAHDLDITQGEDYRDGWTFAIDGVAVDLTGATAVMQLRRTANGPVLATAAVTLGGTAGTISYFIAKAATALLSGTGVYDLKLTYANGEVQYLMAGKFTIFPRITP